MKIVFTLIFTFFIAYNGYSQCGGSDPTADGPSWNNSETIQKNYNDARRWEEYNLGLTANCLGNMIEPNIGWGNMSVEAVALYIHNSERVARGELPLYDVEENLDDVAEAHSAWQIENGVFSHGGDPNLGFSSTYSSCFGCVPTSGSSFFERINQSYPLQFQWQWESESIALSIGTASLNDFVSERIHALIYRDATSSWGHRHAVLHTFTNDWGASNTEGFIGVGVSEGSNYQNCLWGCMNFPFAQILTIDYYDPQGGAIGFSFKGLPIELLAFSAEKINDVVHLSWSTASEINSDYFIIEKSIDGYHFEELELIDAAGVSNSVINYSGVDKNIVFGKNYYRLKQVDLDGTFLYSDVVNVEFDREDSVLVSPNPFKNKLLIEGYFFSNYNELTLMNLKGEIIYSSSINKGEQKVEINIPNLKNGVYFIQIKNNKKQNIYKVIKI